MWTVDQKDFYLLRDGGGQPFTAFVDALIRTHGFVNGVGEADILTSLRINVPDGGVDTQVRTGMPKDATGFLLERSCWQYKARSHKDIAAADLQNEIRKPYVSELIRQGYAYRIAICDDLPASKQTDWEKLLTGVAREINPDAPEARVATASQLASWANGYPALLPAHFRIDPGPVQYFESWGPSIIKATPEFVPVVEWQGAIDLIQGHIDLMIPAHAPIVTVQGVAGVGKTRMVYEVLAKLPAANNMVFYTADGDDAETVARFLANNKRTRGILVADECPVSSRAGISKILSGHTDRVRVVCIDNSGERISVEQELWLDQLSSATVEKVLASNFDRVPLERRRAYAQVARGYIRLAADMCEFDAEIQSKGHFGPALDAIQEYYRQRLPEERQQRAVESIALLQKVGFGEGVGEELDALCEFTGQNRQEVLEIATALKDAPGFVARTTRYLYITPEIIAAVAFERAWHRWFQYDPPAVLRRMPPILIPSFQARIASSASKQVRELTGQFFFESISTLEPSDLANSKTMDRFTTLINTNPDLYFPQLISLVSRAKSEDLLLSEGGLGRGGSRRIIVRTAERLAAFPKYFRGAERILRRLALAETEKSISNNATGVWKELFRIYLSGTAIPFPERIELLGELLFSKDSKERSLALRGLEGVFDLTGTHLVGPIVIAGQLVPPDWQPKTAEDFTECLKLALELLDRLIGEGDTSASETAWATLAKHTRAMLAHGALSTLRTIVGRRPIPDAYLPKILEAVDDSLQYEGGGITEQIKSDPYFNEVLEWRTAITPRDWIGRLKAVISKDPWHHSMREDISAIPSEVEPLADELSRDPRKFEDALPFLNSEQARSAALLGEALAGLDPEGKYLDKILTSAAKGEFAGFSGGYVGRLLNISPQHSSQLNAWLDRLEVEAPQIAYVLALSAPSVASPFDRTMRMINTKKLQVQALQNFLAGNLLDRMSSADITQALETLLQSGDMQNLHIAVDFIAYGLQKGRVDTFREIRDVMWRVLKASASVDDRAGFWWAEVVQKFADAEPEQACDVAILGILGQEYEKRSRAWGILVLIAQKHPEMVMAKIGTLLLDPENGWTLRTTSRSHLFHSIPVEVVQHWLQANGLQGARMIATHLQPPFVDSTGNPKVPALTEYVLATWGEDEAVFGRFWASTHHLQTYSGDIADEHKQEAERAKVFLQHPILAVRKWAENEVALGEQQAQQWNLRMEEMSLE